MKEKSNLVDIMTGLIKNLKNKYNIQAQYLCCNNAGENVAIEKGCKQEGLSFDFQFIAPGMPQQNGHVKRKFCTLFNWVCIMLNGSKFNAYL